MVEVKVENHLKLPASFDVKFLGAKMIKPQYQVDKTRSPKLWRTGTVNSILIISH